MYEDVASYVPANEKLGFKYDKYVLKIGCGISSKPYIGGNIINVYRKILTLVGIIGKIQSVE